MKIFYTTTSDLKNAEQIAKKLLENKGAVCVNLIKNVKSIYIDNGELNETAEIIIIIKTSLKKKEVEKFLYEFHSYDTPLIIEIKTSKPNEKYFEWFLKNSR
jgi:uncharacterized protein involved in tolerance to divalent cations|tara:strand:- start:1827 stop:2132 length:306 start_codon:yes stop_codon:yes gene_type:complete